MTEAEVHTICTRYESFRLRDPSREKRLLQSILEQGIREPLQCVPAAGAHRHILLDGFKRLRCSRKLGLHVVPVVTLGEDEVGCILEFLRLSAHKSLSSLEQARFVDELHERYGLGLGDIAERLERSRAWVSVRLGMMAEMSPVVREEVFAGRFPVRSYLYTLRPLTRVAGISGSRIEAFVRRVSGQGLSTRDIHTLAQGYFRGAEPVRRQIEEGQLAWTLRRLRAAEAPEAVDQDVHEAQQSVIRDLERARACLHRVQGALRSEGWGSSEAFHARVVAMVQALRRAIEGLRVQLKEGS
jgi:ParB-like chromosome segregation protein Spo0J